MMIRAFRMADIQPIMDIWLSANIEAHEFIPASYWQEQYEAVKAMLPQAEIYVYEREGVIGGFVGLVGDYIAGIFVQAQQRSHGVGKMLLETIKKQHSPLSLQVYQKNDRAIRFYQREGFVVTGEGVDQATGEIELLMQWKADH